MSEKIPKLPELEEILSEIEEPVKKLEQNKSMFATDVCPVLKNHLKSYDLYASEEDAEIRILPTGIACIYFRESTEHYCSKDKKRCHYQRLLESKETLQQVRGSAKQVNEKSMFTTEICPILKGHQRVYLKNWKNRGRTPRNKEDAEIRILPTGVVCGELNNDDQCNVISNSCPYKRLARELK